MTKNQLYKRLSAFGDGALGNGRKARIARALERDPALAKQLERQRALGRLVRESWAEGPAAPPTDYLVAALRPELSRVDRERNAEPWLARLVESVWLRGSTWLRPSPLGLSAAAAFLVALAVLPRAQLQTAPMTANWPQATRSFFAASENMSHEPSSTFAPASTFPFDDAAAGVYDLTPGERPAMLFRNPDGTTLLWLLDPDDLSFDLAHMDRWG